VIRQRFKLPVTVAVTDDEKVGDDRVGAEIEEDNILSLLVLNNLNDMSSQV
jgi:hypothetical protein